MAGRAWSAEEPLVRQILQADLKKRLDAEFAAGPRALTGRTQLYCRERPARLDALRQDS